MKLSYISKFSGAHIDDPWDIVMGRLLSKANKFNPCCKHKPDEYWLLTEKKHLELECVQCGAVFEHPFPGLRKDAKIVIKRRVA